MAGKPTKMSLVTEEEQARFRSMAKMIMLCESLERAHSPEKFSSNYSGRGGPARGPQSVVSQSSSQPSPSLSAQSPSKRRFLQAVDFASTGSHAVDLMKVNEVLDYRTTITKESHYVDRFFDAWRGGKPSMVRVSGDRHRLQRCSSAHRRIRSQVARSQTPAPSTMK
jgi:hypothetical protein